MLLLTQFAFADEGEEATKYYGVLSLVTPFIAIVLSFITKQVVLSLATAVLVGATIINGGNLFHGFLRTCDTLHRRHDHRYLERHTLIFILSVGGLIAVMSKMGGTQAMALPWRRRQKRQELTDYHLDYGYYYLL